MSKHQECPTCLSMKRVWDGRDYISCPTCNGVGLVVPIEEEEDDVQEFPEELTEPYDEFKHSREEDSINPNLD